MSDAEQHLWLVELDGGRARVIEANSVAIGMDLVIEIEPGDSHDDIPYEVWAQHVGEYVDVDQLRREKVAPPLARLNPLDDEALTRLRSKTAFLFALLAAFGAISVYLTLAQWFGWNRSPDAIQPDGGFVSPGIAALQTFVLGLTTVAWVRLTPRIWRGESPPPKAQLVGWTHFALAALLGLAAASIAAAHIWSFAFWYLVAAAVSFEAGRGYLRLSANAGSGTLHELPSSD